MDLPIFSESLEASAPANLPQELTNHLPVAQAAAARNLEAAKARYGPDLTSLQSQLRHAQTPAVPVGSKLIRLRHIAGERSRFFASSSACGSGCNHCCHIETTVPRSEAKVIAKAIGRRLAEPDAQLNIQTIAGRRKFFGVPCSFLVDGKCSIYAHRPLVCRTLVNLDSVDTLCRLVPGVEVPVPYLQAVEMQGYFAYLTQDEQYADIREWFPPA
jgi:Fe-S-cluster containining protein